MIPIIWQSNPAWLLDSGPTSGDPVELTATFDVQLSAGETGREQRQPLAQSPQFSISFSSFYRGTAVARLRNSLQTFRTEPILCPLWPAIRKSDNYQFEVDSEWWVVLERGRTAYVLDVGSFPVRFPVGTLLCPAMRVRLIDFPQPRAYSPELVRVEWQLIEDGPSLLSLKNYDWETGPTTGSGTKPLWPFRQNSGEDPETQIPSWNLHEENLGHTKVALRYAEPQPTRRVERTSFILTGKDPWRFLSFWAQRKGTADSFWFPGGLNESRLSAPALPGHTALSVANGTALGDNSYVMLHDSKKRVAARVLSKVGNVWNLSGPVGQSFDPTHTIIWPLQLARFESPKLSIQFEHSALARAKCSTVEVPWEMTIPPGESEASHGATATRAYLYTFRSRLPDSVREWRFTDFETPVTFGTLEYQPAQIEHGEIKQVLGLDPDTVELRADAGIQSPLRDFIPKAPPFPLSIEISEVQLNDVTPTKYTLFTGQVRSVEMDLPKLVATCSALGGLGDRQFPRRVTGIRCNWRLFGPGCKLDQNAWKWTGLVTGWNAATGTLSIGTLKKNGVTVAASSLAEHLFAAGYIEIGTGDAVAPRWITDSAIPTAGAITVILDEGFIAAPAVGTVVSLWAGCDLRYDTCINRFGNGVNFGGYPNTVIGNPVVARIKLSTSQGAKK